MIVYKVLSLNDWQNATICLEILHLHLPFYAGFLLIYDKVIIQI